MCAPFPSVLRHAWIDLVAPGENATHHVLHFSKARLTKKVDRFPAADAAAAVCDNFLAGIQFMHSAGKLAEGDELRAGNPADLILVRLTDIDQHKAVAVVPLRLHLHRVDLPLGKALDRDRLRLVTGHPAELLVVDEFRDCRMVSAGETFGVPAQL